MRGASEERPGQAEILDWPSASPSYGGVAKVKSGDPPGKAGPCWSCPNTFCSPVRATLTTAVLEQSVTRPFNGLRGCRAGGAPRGASNALSPGVTCLVVVSERKPQDVTTKRRSCRRSFPQDPGSIAPIQQLNPSHSLFIPEPRHARQSQDPPPVMPVLCPNPDAGGDLTWRAPGLPCHRGPGS